MESRQAILNRKKEEERFLGGMVKMVTLAWQLSVMLDKTQDKDLINPLQKQDTKMNLHTN